VLAARGVCVVLHTFASLGVPHHPPLTLTPLGLATQDFRLASGTLFSPAECNLRGIVRGILDRTIPLRSVRDNMKGKYGLNSAAKGNQDSGGKGLYAFICIIFRMTIHSIGKTRESLNWSSENYKDAIREYLDTEGYSQISDSFIEGDLSDMVFINPSLSVGEKTLVESKATSISSADEKLALEVVKYLVEWLKLDPQERFKFFIFTKSITKKVELSLVEQLLRRRRTRMQ